MNRLIKGLGTVAAAIGVMTLASNPASAVELWQPWVPPSSANNIACGATKHHEKSDYVFFQTCIIHGSGKYLQPVLIISNTSDKKIKIYGQVFSGWKSSTDYSYCSLSDLSPGARTSCYGATTAGKIGENAAWSQFYMNGQENDDSMTSPVVTFDLY